MGWKLMYAKAMTRKRTDFVEYRRAMDYLGSSLVFLFLGFRRSQCSQMTSLTIASVDFRCEPWSSSKYDHIITPCFRAASVCAQ